MEPYSGAARICLHYVLLQICAELQSPFRVCKSFCVAAVDFVLVTELHG
jgi:hypothetical protein